MSVVDSRPQTPEWARLLSAMLYGSATLKLAMGGLAFAVLRSAWQGGWNTHVFLLASWTTSSLVVGAAEILAARALKRSPHLAPWCLTRLAALVTVLAVFQILLLASLTIAMLTTTALLLIVVPAFLFWPVSLATYLPAIILLRRRRPQMLRRPGDPECCPGCGYTLVGLTSDRCPECGMHVAGARIAPEASEAASLPPRG